MTVRRAAREGGTPASGRLQVVEARGPGPRAVRSFRILLAHDARASTCDQLVRAVEAALVNVEVVDTSSIDDALLAAATERFDAFMVCLDLPPAPLGGARLASDLVDENHPVVLVTRSLRWLPADKPSLQKLPWIAPDAGATEVAGAIKAATSDCHSVVRTRVPLPGGLRGALRVRR